MNLPEFKIWFYGSNRNQLYIHCDETIVPDVLIQYIGQKIDEKYINGDRLYVSDQITLSMMRQSIYHWLMELVERGELIQFNGQWKY